MKLGLMVTRPPYTYQDIDTLYYLSKAAIERKHQVKIFLYIDSVIAANKDLNSSKERNLYQRMEELANLGAEIKICGVCVQFRGIKRDQLLPVGELEGLPGLADMVNECDKFINL